MENQNDFSESIDRQGKTQSDSHNQSTNVAVQSVYLKLALPISIILAAVIISGSLLYIRNNNEGPRTRTGSTASDKPVKVNVDSNDRVLGNDKARITIIEFSDFQCPFCRSFWQDTLPTLKKDYIDTGRARLVYKHFPLDFHPGAKPFALAAECAGDQNKFWEMHDKIFTEQAKQGSGTITFKASNTKKWASELGLDTAIFNQCFDSGKYANKIENDSKYGASLGVSGTPSFFINGINVVGAQPLANFVTVINQVSK